MIPQLPLSLQIRNDLVCHAIAQWPKESCGWIQRGIVRRADNIAATSDEFSFAPADLLTFANECDSSTPPVALYHSHPNGDTRLSTVDIRRALTAFGPAYPVAQIVIAGAPPWSEPASEPSETRGTWEIAVWTWDRKQQAYILDALYPVNS
jgi:proteasome lid subunit RPN8/RPN11